MPRYRRNQKPKQAASDLERGFLARLQTPILEGETRCFNYTTLKREWEPRFPVGSSIELRVMYRPLVAAEPFIDVSGYRGMTLIEKPQEDRLRILFLNGWWLEVQLASFHKLLTLAAANYGEDLPPLTTVAIRADIVPTPRPVEV